MCWTFSLFSFSYHARTLGPVKLDLAFGVVKHANRMNGEAVQLVRIPTIGKCTGELVHYNWEVYR